LRRGKRQEAELSPGLPRDRRLGANFQPRPGVDSIDQDDSFGVVGSAFHSVHEPS
jgi:hypothetical protein